MMVGDAKDAGVGSDKCWLISSKTVLPPETGFRLVITDCWFTRMASTSRRRSSSSDCLASSSKLDPSAFFAMIDDVVAAYPQIKIVATTLRDVHSTNRHTWSAVAWISGKTYTAPTCELDVYDRVGGGDGFAAGLFYGLLSGESPEDAVRLGWAHGALLTAFPGDTTMATVDQVRAFAKGGSARIQR